jgi:ribosomal protein S18 acetylase RimI-like enzyme
VIRLPPDHTPDILIRQADPTHLDRVAELFDLYRQFYGQPADLALARAFLSERTRRGESIILVASRDNQALVGFAQLYPTFCSISAAPIYVLHDLYVESSSRRGGIGRALVEASTAHARKAGAARVELATAMTNDIAQALYEALGWVRDNEFYQYSFTLR